MRLFFVVLALAGLSACSGTETETTAPELSRANTAAYNCLKEAIYFEAGAVPNPGREAVAHVIMNRVKDSRFPGDVCGVIQEGEDRRRCQFSYRCDLDPTVIRWPSQMEQAEETARKVLAGASADPTKGALFFHAKWMRPGWFATRKRVGQFGGNIFYL